MPPPNEADNRSKNAIVPVSLDVENAHHSEDKSNDSVDLSVEEPIVIKNKEQLEIEKQASSA